MSKSKRCFNVKSSTYYFHMKTKILADFQICISALLERDSNTDIFLWILRNKITFLKNGGFYQMLSWHHQSRAAWLLQNLFLFQNENIKIISKIMNLKKKKKKKKKKFVMFYYKIQWFYQYKFCKVLKVKIGVFEIYSPLTQREYWTCH